jgi:hypothetical protein
MTASMSWELDPEHEQFRASVRQRRMKPWDTVRSGELGDFSYSGVRDVVEYGGPQGDISAMEDLAGPRAVQQAVAAEAAPTA